MTEDGHTALHIACDCNQQAAIRYLLGVDGIDLYPKTRGGKIPYDLLEKFGVESEFMILKRRS